MKKFFLILIFSCLCLNGMVRTQKLHPQFTLEEANNIRNFLRKELNEPSFDVDFPHILTPYFVALNEKSQGFHLANSPGAQNLIVSHDVDVSNGCYQGQFTFANKLYTSTFFPDRWSYKEFAACLISLLKTYKSFQHEKNLRNEKRPKIKGTYVDSFGEKIEASMIYDKDNKKVITAFPGIQSPNLIRYR